MSGILDKFKDAVFEHDDSVRSQPNTNPPSAAPQSSSIYSDGASTTSTRWEGGVYDHFLAVTDLGSVPELQKFYQAMDKLRAIISDPNVQMKAALATSGASVDALVSSVRSLKSTLQAEVSKGQAKLKQSAIDAATQQGQLEKQLVVAREATARLDRTQANFASAATRRAAELDQLEQQLNNLR